MCRKMIVLIFFVLLLGVVSNAEDIQWVGGGADNLWSTPENWDLGRVPTLGDDVLIDVPAAAAPNGPVIQDGIDAECNGIWTEAVGEPTLTMTGGSLVVGEWIWWGDGDGSYGIWTMSGGTVSVTNEFELGWGGGAGTLIMTGGTINAGEAVIPTGSGAFGLLYLNGGTYNVTQPGGLEVNATGMVDITEGTLVLEGDDTVKVNDLVTAGLITAYGGAGQINVDFDLSNPGKTTVTATIEKTVLFAEDFEDLVLGPNIDEALAGDAVWTDTPPEGWVVDESGIPGIGMDVTDGITEWAGWAFVDKAWWIEAAEDQDRSLFELGIGIVAVADPDEWDDGERLPIPISANPYDTWLTTPAIVISDVEVGTLELKFDSSWRPEFDDNYHQTATITASFDGGEPVTVLLWESDGASANYHPYATNETVIVKLDNPDGARKVVLTFGLFDAGNDWWWAIDNIEVRGVVPYLGPVKPSDEGLIAHWAFDESEGDIVNDSSGNDNHGTIVGTGTEWVAGKINGALSFIDGAGYVEVPDNPTLNTTEEITIAAWLNPTWTGNNRVLQKGASDNQYRLLREWGDSLFLDLDGVENGRLEASPCPADNEWHHVTGTYNSVEMKIYYDGELVAEQAASGAIATSGDPLYIGTKHATAPPQDYFYGTMDELYFYSRALSEAEIRYLAGERAMPIDPGTDGLLACYPLDGDPNDSSGNGIHGTIYNAETGGLGDGGSVWVDDPERGTVISFNGTASGAYVRAGEIPQMTLTNDFTWAFWAKQKAENTLDNDIILGNRMDENVVDFVPRQFIKFTPTKFEWHMNGNGDDNLEYDDIPADVWLHHAVVKTGDQLTYYRNGDEHSSGVFTQPLDFPQPLFFGGDNEGKDTENWNGLMSDVCIYDRALSAGEIRYLADIREFEYDGGELDDTWDHDNGSDAWDGTAPGEGNPGGAATLTEDDVTFLRIQDTGDPRDLGISDPSNRKVYLIRPTDISLDGLRIEVRMRVATTPPLDDQLSGDPWPAEGIGYHIRDNGKGMIGVSDGASIISFSLGQAGEADYPDATSDLLVMNNLVGTEPSGDVDTGDTPEMNAVAIDDAAQWNTFVIDIVAGGAGTHIVTVSANGGLEQSFDVTAGTGTEADVPYVTIGSSGTGGITAFDVDFIKVSN